MPVSEYSPILLLGAALACGAMIGIERGWRLRTVAPGTRVAGIRTYTLLAGGGGVAALLGSLISPTITALLVLATGAGVVIAYWRDPAQRDSTSFVAAIVALSLGLLAGSGQPQLAVAGAAVITLILATRNQSHGLVARLSEQDVQAFARYAVIAVAVLPFLPNRTMGPLDAWNPFQLWLVVVLITGVSFAGYIANRTIGVRHGVLATAIIGGAYSSTAATAALAQRLGKGETGPYVAGMILASAMMYLRVILLVAVLSPSTLVQFLITVGPAVAVGLVAAAVAWMRVPAAAVGTGDVVGNPIELLPAFGFVAIVAVAAIMTRWAQQQFGESGIAISLFVAGSFDVDAAIVTLSGLPVEAIDRRTGAIAIAGTIVANMALKMLIAGVYSRGRGKGAVIALGASALVLTLTIGWRLLLV